MAKPRLKTIAVPLLISALLGGPCGAAENQMRVAVIGGLDMSGVWPRLEAAAEESLKIGIDTVVAAPKERVVPAFQSGDADVLIMHGGDETFALEALGSGSAGRTWGYNGFVFAGPADDPAGIAEVSSGRDAMLRLQQSGAPLILFRDVGSLQIIRRLMDSAGLVPRDINLITDSAGRPQEILLQAARDRAYVIVGQMPVAFGRMERDGIEILFSGDRAMRRGYVIVTPGPLHAASPWAIEQSERLAEYLLSESGQAVVQELKSDDGTPWIYPRTAASALIEFNR